MSSEIPFIRPTFPSPEAVAAAYAEVVEANWFTNFGPQERRFAGAVGSYLGDGLHVATFANGTLALLAAVQCVFGRGDGTQHLLVPSFTFAAAPQAAVWCGYRPAWCDVDPETWQPDVASARRVLATHGDQVAGIVMANVFGVGDPRIADWEALAAEHRLPMVIDSAAGFGSSYSRDEHVGGRGTCEIFSFHATKPFAIGEGGALVTRDPDLARAAQEFQNFGFDASRQSQVLGLNGKLQELNAAIGLAQLDGFDERLAGRRRVFDAYREALEPSGLTFQPNAELSSLCFAAAVTPTAAQRDELLARWQAAGIQVRAYYNPPVHRQPLFAGTSSVSADLAVTDDIAARIVSLPVHDAMSPGDVARVTGIATVARGGDRT